LAASSRLIVAFKSSRTKGCGEAKRTRNYAEYDEKGLAAYSGIYGTRTVHSGLDVSPPLQSL
jgi:hypothetical protein